jgi:hypothetical protein
MAPEPVPPVPAKDKATAGDAAKPAATAKLELDPGETTIDDQMAIEVELAAYDQLHVLAAEIRRRVDRRIVRAGAEAGGKAHVFYLDDALRQALDLSSVLALQLDNLEAAYDGVTASATPPSPAPRVPRIQVPKGGGNFAAKCLGLEVTSLIGGVAGLAGVANPVSAAADAAVALLGAMRADTRYAGRQVTVPQHAFALVLARQWEESAEVEFHYPTLFSPPSTGGTGAMRAFVDAMDAVVAARKAAARALAALLGRLSRMKQEDHDYAGVKAELDAARDQFQAADVVFEELSSKLSKADPATGLTQMQLLERAADVKAIEAEAPEATYFLYAQVVSARGAFRISRNVFQMLFWRDGLKHAGGGIAAFGLFDDAGHLLMGDTIGRRCGYVDSRPEQQAGMG